LTAADSPVAVPASQDAAQLAAGFTAALHMSRSAVDSTAAQFTAVAVSTEAAVTAAVIGNPHPQPNQV
jgi:hypothetical protein